MKLNSKYFDCIRVKPEEDRLQQTEDPTCDWPGCGKPAGHPAPRGRGREGEYFNFCTSHVREYNKSYNYFNGMSDDDVAEFQKANLTGHRPTWSVSTNGRRRAGKENSGATPDGFSHEFSIDDPLGAMGGATGTKGPRDAKPAKPVRKAERKCLRALDLESTATGKEIKTRFKLLVKRHHPDHNGGDRRSEDKLREVIQAYNYLKEAGLC
jgi:curved DNA-binding protein CbpA